MIPKKLAQFVVPATETTVYVVPASTNTMIKEVLIANTSSSAQTVSLSLVPFGNTASNINRLLPAVYIGPNSMTTFNLSTVMATGDFLSVLASAPSAVTMTISGLEAPGAGTSAGTSNFASTGMAVTSATRPATPYASQVIFETDTKIAYVYTGTAWREISAPRYAAKLHRNTNLAIAGGFAATNVPMDTLGWADDSVVFQGGANYTCPIAGLYEATANIESDTGLRLTIGLNIGGTGLEGGGVHPPNTTYATRLNMSGMASCNAGATIYAYLWNDNDTAGNVREGSAFTWMTVQRIGPRHDSGAA